METVSISRHKYHKKTLAERTASAAIHLFLILVAMICLFPFLHVLSVSFSDNASAMSKSVYLWPVHFTLSSYAFVMADSTMVRSLLVTVMITIGYVVLGMTLTICAAYPLTNKKLRGRAAISLFFMFTMYFSGGVIPDYLLMRDLHILNKWPCLVLPLAFSAYNIIILRSFIASTIPDSLEEAALLDGCSYIGILWRIVLPLSKPVLATLCLFFAVGRWNMYQDSLYYITDSALYPLQLKLYYLMGLATDTATLAEGGSNTYIVGDVIKATCVMFATIPIIVVYPFIQKYFVTGVMIGAVKG